MNNIVKQLPEMLTGTELKKQLTVLPRYDKGVLKKSQTERLLELNNIYDVYLPNKMSYEIYTKLYLALVRSLQKKDGIDCIKQRNQNGRSIAQKNFNSIVGGTDSFSIIAPSGLGKSSAINRAIEVISKNIIIGDLDQRIIPCLVIQCPFDSSVKGMLLEILTKVDNILETNYYNKIKRSNTTTDILISSVSQICLNHIGLLIIDEIQNVVKNKNGKNLIGCLTQLINNSGTSICLVGTPVSALFFEKEFQLARRTQGLRYERLEYDEYFIELCDVLLSCRYVEIENSLKESLYEWLYERTGGITSVVVSLIHDSQEIAILSGKEKLTINSFEAAFNSRVGMLHQFIEIDKNIPKYTNIKNTNQKYQTFDTEDKDIIANLFDKSKAECLDFINLLEENNLIEVISI